MTVEEFLTQLNTAQKGWGLWLNRKNGRDYHIGQYAFENDRMPKSFLHVDNLDHLAHQRLAYIKSHAEEQMDEASLSKQWAENYLVHWRTQYTNAQAIT